MDDLDLDFTLDQDELEPWSPFVVFSVRLSGGISNRIAPQIWTKGEKGSITTSNVYVKQKKLSVNTARQQIIDSYKERLTVGGKQIKSLAKFKNIPDTFMIRVGVLDENKKHVSPRMKTQNGIQYGIEIGYDELFQLLFDMSSGTFDPLTPIRSLSFENKVERELSNKILNVFNRRAAPTPSLFRTVLKRYAEKLKNIVLDYLDSGKKPPLSQATKNYYRPAKKSLDGSLYGKGDDTSLYETGQLYDAIDVDFEFGQSSEMSEFIKKHRNSILDRQKRVRKNLTEAQRVQKQEQKRIDELNKSQSENIRLRKKSLSKAGKIGAIFADESVSEEELKKSQKDFEKTTKRFYDAEEKILEERSKLEKENYKYFLSQYDLYSGEIKKYLELLKAANARAEEIKSKRLLTGNQFFGEVAELQSSAKLWYRKYEENKKHLEALTKIDYIRYILMQYGRIVK